jgi:hypothetical protein
LDKNPKINNPTKKRTTMLTTIFRVSICGFSQGVRIKIDYEKFTTF